MNSHETHVDVWSRVLLAAALLLLINQMQWVPQASSGPAILQPGISGAVQDAARYPQPVPASNDSYRNWVRPAPQTQAVTVRQASWVF